MSGSGADLIESLDRDGFVVVRGLLDAQEIALLGEAFDRLLARARTLEGTTEIQGSQFVVDPDPFRLHRVVWAGGAEPEIARYGDDPRFVALAEATLRTSPVVQLLQQAHFKIPGDEVVFDWHQDAANRRYGTELWEDVDGRGSFVQIAVAIDPMSAANGGLRMVRGSHRLGFVSEVGTGVVPERFLEGELVDLELAPGDAAVFGPFVIHGSGPNRGAIPRRLFLQGYAAPGANRRSYPGSGLGIERGARESPPF